MRNTVFVWCLLLQRGCRILWPLSRFQSEHLGWIKASFEKSSRRCRVISMPALQRQPSVCWQFVRLDSEWHESSDLSDSGQGLHNKSCMHVLWTLSFVHSTSGPVRSLPHLQSHTVWRFMVPINWREPIFSICSENWKAKWSGARVVIFTVWRNMLAHCSNFSSKLTVNLNGKGTVYKVHDWKYDDMPLDRSGV